MNFDYVKDTPDRSLYRGKDPGYKTETIVFEGEELHEKIMEFLTENKLIRSTTVKAVVALLESGNITITDFHNTPSANEPIYDPVMHRTEEQEVYSAPEAYPGGQNTRFSLD